MEPEAWEHNVETGEITVRPLTPEELAIYEAQNAPTD